MPLEHLPYQVEGAGVLVQHKRFGLFDVMGLGKTATLVKAIDDVGAQRGLAVMPATLRQNFITEYRKFGRQKLRLCKGMTIHDYIAWSRGRYDMLVTSYELATKWAKEFRKDPEFLDVIVIDEGHYLKTPDAARTKALLGHQTNLEHCWVEWADYAWWATGTPIPNDPIDIYTFLRFCNAFSFSLGEFTRRYFYVRQTEFGTRQTVRPDMQEELRRLIDAYSIRRTKEGVGLQIPPIFLTTAVVDGDSGPVLDILRQHPELEDAILRAVENGGLSFLEAGHVATLRRLIGEAKAVPYAHELLEEMQSGAGKRVVFGISRNALAYVRDFLVRNGVRAVLVQGGVSEPERNEAVRMFQEDEDCRVFLGNIKAAGTGLTLTAACEIDMLESDWTPAGNAQALMRVHRIGQTQTVWGRFISLANSFDEHVNELVVEKTAQIAAVEGVTMHAAPS